MVTQIDFLNKNPEFGDGVEGRLGFWVYLLFRNVP